MKCAINCLGCESGNPEEQGCLNSIIMDEPRAREILEQYVNKDNSIGYSWWCPDFNDPALFYPDENTAFTADELEAIAWWMRNKGEK